MKRESFKSLVLVALVVMSTYFIQQIWLDVPFSLLPLFGTKTDDVKKNNMSNIIVPEKYLVNFSEKDRTVIYSDKDYKLWSEARDILKKILQEKELTVDKISDEEFIAVNKKWSINFYFSEEVYTYIVGKTLNVDIPNQVYDNMKKFDSIYFYLGEKPFITFTDGTYHLKVTFQSTSIDGLRQITQEIDGSNYTKYYSLTEVLPGVQNNAYIPLTMTYGVPQVSVNNEIDIQDDAEIDSIAKLFFDRNIDYIRRIEENDGSVIYIDNQKNLKLYTNGTIEYFNALDGTINDRNFYLSLKKAIDFIDNHMGLPNDTYLSDVREIEFEDRKGYKFIFRYRINGLTVVSGQNKLSDFIEIEIFNDQVKSYKRRVWVADSIHNTYDTDDAYRNILSAYNIIEKKFDFLREKYIEDNKMQINETNKGEIDNIVKSSINNVYLAYYDDLDDASDILKPVWIINMAGYNYAFDAYGGYEENGGSLR
ncbi:hypothetical protein [Brassicibacter mesophilus]|jgi:hypothetical protein|uniref:hypothetical protein n=1 Tax=Brassicibacter mesophilus TaxID=745119 RepID=UPI003D21355D